MKHALACTVLLCLAVPLQSLADQGQSMTQDEKATLAAVENMTRAFQAGDIGAVMNSYEETAAVLFEPGEPVVDSATLNAMFSTMAQMSPEFSYPKGHEVVVVGDIALHIAPWSMLATGPDGAELSQSGLSVAVLRKQADGVWKMVIDNPNGDHLMRGLE